MRGGLETEQNCNIMTPTLLAKTVFLSHSPGLLNRGPGGPASLGHVPQPSIFSPTAQSGVPRPPSAGCYFLYRVIFQLPDFLSSPGLYNCFTPTQSLPITGQRNMQLPPSLEWHVWSSSSGNNCHAVHRSPSSGASVFEPCPVLSAKLDYAISSHHWLTEYATSAVFGMACLVGLEVNIQQYNKCFAARGDYFKGD